MVIERPRPHPSETAALPRRIDSAQAKGTVRQQSLLSAAAWLLWYRVWVRFGPSPLHQSIFLPTGTPSYESTQSPIGRHCRSSPSDRPPVPRTIHVITARQYGSIRMQCRPTWPPHHLAPHWRLTHGRCRPRHGILPPRHLPSRCPAGGHPLCHRRVWPCPCAPHDSERPLRSPPTCHTRGRWSSSLLRLATCCSATGAAGAGPAPAGRRTPATPAARLSCFPSRTDLRRLRAQRCAWPRTPPAREQHHGHGQCSQGNL